MCVKRRVYPLCPLAMSLGNVVTLADKMEKAWVLARGLVPNFDGGGTLLLVGFELCTHV